MNASLLPRFVLPLWLGCTIPGCDAKNAAKPAATSPSGNPPGVTHEKDVRTPAQTKLDSHIVLALKKSRREPPFDKPTELDPDLAIEADGCVLSDLKADVTPALTTAIEACGGKVISSFSASRAVRARLPLSRMEELAARADVQFIAPAAQSATNGGTTQGSVIRP